MHRHTPISTRWMRIPGIVCAALTVLAASVVQAQTHTLDTLLYAVEPGVAVAFPDDPAAEKAARQAAQSTGLYVFPATKGSVIMGDSALTMQGDSLNWRGNGEGMLLLAEETVQLPGEEATRFEWGTLPPFEHSSQGPQYTPVFEEVLGYAIDADAYRAPQPGRYDTYLLFEYAVNTVDGPETHRFSVHRTGPMGDWSAIVKSMPDGGHLVLFHRMTEGR